MSRIPASNFCFELKKENKNEKKSDERLGEKSTTSKPERIKTLTRAARSDMTKVKLELKSKLPMLTATEVRRFRIPHHEAVILELEEEGLEDTVQYLKILFEEDEEMRIKAGPGTQVWKKPRLKNDKIFVEQLKTGLSTAEVAKKSGKRIAQAAALLDTALIFESKTWDWHWIADKLFASALKIAENIKDDEGQTLNVIRYLYGRFIFTKLKDPQRALEHLNKVRVAAEGKLWNASKILGVKQQSLYRESCTLLHKALLNMTRDVRDEDPELSIRAAMFSLNRATDSVHNEYVAAALYELGKSQLSAGNIKLALKNLSKFLAIAKRIPDAESICNAHLELAFAYKELEDNEGTVKHLSLLRQCATDNKLLYKLAQSHYYIGEFLLNKSQAKLATPHLELALSKFNSLGKTAEADRARCAAGVSKGQEVISQYLDLIKNCDGRKENTETILKLCHWKNNRVPFWICPDEVASSNTNEDTIPNASLLSLTSISTNKSFSTIENDEIVIRQVSFAPSSDPTEKY